MKGKEEAEPTDQLGEVISLRDESCGFVVELRSAKIEMPELLKMSYNSFKFLRRQRNKSSKKMTGVN